MRLCESWLLSYLFNSLWQVPLLVAAGWVAARALRGNSPAAEHRVWVSVLLAQSILPALSVLPAGWMRWLWNLIFIGQPPGNGNVSVAMGAGTAASVFRISGGLLAAIALAFAVTCAWFAARFAWRCARLAVLRREAVAIDPEAAESWARCTQRFHVEGVSIGVSDRVFGPVTMGIFRRLVLLPSTMAAGLPEADFDAVVAHEFAHIRRHDFLKNLVYELLSLPVSYHPLFRLTRERVMETREMVCDLMAAGISGRSEYSRSLLRLASLLVEGAPVRIPHAIGIFDANTLERRLMRLNEVRNEMRGVRRAAIAAFCAALGVATCASAVGLGVRVDASSSAGDDHGSKPAPITVPSGEMAKNRISGPVPTYPPEAKKARVQGAVLLDALIGEDGSVKNLKVVSGPKPLVESALDAVHQWVYKPYLLNGEPIEVKTTITVTYTLAK
jgi:TonB family protein